MPNFVLSFVFFAVAFAMYVGGSKVLAAVLLVGGLVIAGTQIGFSMGLIDAGGDPGGDSGDGDAGDGGGGDGGD